MLKAKEYVRIDELPRDGLAKPAITGTRKAASGIAGSKKQAFSKNSNAWLTLA